MFSQACDKNFVHGGGVQLPWRPPRHTLCTHTHMRAHLDTHTSLRRHPAPPPRRPLQRTVRILLECILVINISLNSKISFRQNSIEYSHHARTGMIQYFKKIDLPSPAKSDTFNIFETNFCVSSYLRCTVFTLIVAAHEFRVIVPGDGLHLVSLL